MLRRKILTVLGLALVATPLAACAQSPSPTPQPTPTGLPTAKPTAPVAATTPSALPATPTAPAGGATPPPSGGNVSIQQSTLSRVAAPSVSSDDLTKLSADNAGFAFDLYKALRKKEGNLFLSPYSISLALAMTYAGAKGATAEQMAKALRFTLPADRLHQAFNSLDQKLASRGSGAKGQDGKGFRLKIANSIWGQADYRFLQQFLDTLAANYGAGLRLLDFIKAPEASRVTINGWVSDQTEGKYPELLAKGIIDDAVRLVLVNAIYFNAAWKNQFVAAATTNKPFTTADGRKVEVPTMSDTFSLRYAKAQGVQAVELPYDGDELSMLVLLPDAGSFDQFEAALTADRVQTILAGLASKQVALSLPKLKYESQFELPDALKSLGMIDAFDSSKADLSGMTGGKDLFISDVIHKAVIMLDEKGTEAAAATAVIARVTSAPTVDVTLAVDRPFVFLIRDKGTGAVVFVGRVTNPT